MENNNIGMSFVIPGTKRQNSGADGPRQMVGKDQDSGAKRQNWRTGDLGRRTVRGPVSGHGAQASVALPLACAACSARRAQRRVISKRPFTGMVIATTLIETDRRRRQ